MLAGLASGSVSACDECGELAGAGAGAGAGGAPDAASIRAARWAASAASSSAERRAAEATEAETNCSHFGNVSNITLTKPLTCADKSAVVSSG